MTIFIGIDPGLTGGIGAINSITGACTAADLPTTQLPGNPLVKRRIDGRAFALLLRQLIPADMAVVLALEQVGTMGGKNNAVQTQGSLMRTLGAIESALDILRITPVMVQPKAWKGSLGLQRKKGEKDAAYKGRSLTLARTLYPDAPLALAKSQNRAEGILLAHFVKGQQS